MTSLVKKKLLRVRVVNLMNKIFNKVVIIDGSYMMHRNLKIPDLWNLRNKSGDRSGGVFGFLRSLNYAVKNNEYYPIICWDSGLSKRRLDIYPDYKNNLEKSKTYQIQDMADEYLKTGRVSSTVLDEDLMLIKQKADEMMKNREVFGVTHDPDDYIVQYRRQRDLAISICNSIGIPSIKIRGWEGDDLIVLVSRMSLKSVIVTDDRDMIQLLSPVTDIDRVVQKEYLTYDSYLKDNNLLSIREVVIHKAIVGDGSDAIPSVTSGESERKYRVGGVTAWRLARVIVENNEDPSKYIPVLEESTRDRNKIIGFIKNHDNYLRNLQLVDLSLVEDDSSVEDSILSEVKSLIGKSNLLESLSKLNEQDIVSLDINGMISKVTTSSINLILE